MIWYGLDLELCCVKGGKIHFSVEGPILPEGPLKDDATEECFAPHLSEALRRGAASNHIQSATGNSTSLDVFSNKAEPVRGTSEKTKRKVDGTSAESRRNFSGK